MAQARLALRCGSADQIDVLGDIVGEHAERCFTIGLRSLKHGISPALFARHRPAPLHIPFVQHARFRQVSDFGKRRVLRAEGGVA